MLRVLQVDDEAMILDLTVQFLDREGFSFRSETSAGNALAALEEERFDALVSDYQMPGMDGIELLKKVRQLHPEMPFILFTGKGREEVAMEALNNGADFYVQKGGEPIAQFGELAHKVRLSIQVRRSKAELKDSEGRLVQTQRLAHVGSWVLEVKENTLKLSEEMFRICGLVPSAFDPHLDNFVALLHPDDRDRFEGELRRAERGSTLLPARFRLVWPKGEVRYLSVQMEPVLDGSKRTTEVAAAISDVTDTVRSEEALRESEARWKFALEGVGDGVYDWDLTKGTLFVNARYWAQLGYRKGDGFITLAEWNDLVHPDDRAAAAGSIKETVNGGKDIYAIEYRMMGPDGQYRWIMDRGKVVTHNSMGAPSRMVGTHVDITERKVAEQALAESKETYRQLVDSLTDGVAIHDGGRVVFMNTAGARIFGYDRPDETYGRTPIEMVHPDSREVARSRIFNNRGEVQPWIQERFLRKDGSSVGVEVITMPITIQDRTAVQVVFRDLTERKAMESALKDANSKLKILGSITRHDLLNQLSIIEGSTALLAKKPLEDGQRKDVERIARAVDNMGRVIKFTKDYEGMGTVEPKWHSVRELWERNSAKFDLGKAMPLFSAEDIEVYADPMLDRVFYNLFDNSLRHGGGVSKIALTSSMDGSDLLLEFSDDGKGVPVDKKQLIFEMGFGSNTGLGLFLSRAILGMTGIGISEAGGPGSGARFIVRVPPSSFRSAPAPPSF